MGWLLARPCVCITVSLLYFQVQVQKLMSWPWIQNYLYLLIIYTGFKSHTLVQAIHKQCITQHFHCTATCVCIFWINVLKLLNKLTS